MRRREVSGQPDIIWCFFFSSRSRHTMCGRDWSSDVCSSDLCFCALVLSISLGFFGGIGAASKEGVLVKGGNYLEALNKIDTIVFDKTGTLTKGVFDVVRIVPVEGVSSGEILRYAAIAESYSNHPIASSILKEYGQQIDKSIIKSFQEMDGYGVKVITKEHVIVAGNKKMMEKERISYEIVSALGTVVYISVD